MRVTFSLLLLLAALPAATAQAPEPRYLAAMREELDAMGLAPLCEPESAIRARCELRHVSPDARHELRAFTLYSDESDTVYVWVPRLVVAPPEDPATPAVLRRIAELNWSMLTTKLEWNPSDGEVRLSAVLHTDSSFDRRAFRNLVRVVLSLAGRHGPQLEALLSREPR
ncbi:MAG: YbjN domain-containing protein [Myxococcales bacterium]|nr:YbjN domain-containing protein [Myxococcales bacterium]